MNSASNLKARLLFVLALTFVGNSRLAAGNNQNAGRKLDEIPGKYFFFPISLSCACQVVVHIYACFLGLLVSYNGTSNSWGLFVIEKFAVLL